MKDQIIALINEMISTKDEEFLEAYETGELEYWDSGNFDDCFQLGTEVGHTQALMSVLHKITNL